MKSEEYEESLKRGKHSSGGGRGGVRKLTENFNTIRISQFV